jgi:hypothetical protein
VIAELPWLVAIGHFTSLSVAPTPVTFTVKAAAAGDAAPGDGGVSAKS